ncbi:hypothetical protein M413DRAFT_277287 [Hebeloma cylindrosporum]|uniref:Zn(2)-C6 fungal-type domain-containing protein n=1 Tax=Hebeloma cylindrosporum TaxID=76867 RepID=A0A0C3BZ43_HEBCY|nr:hypothetical protein M413DRAFT_277287 [Hebeloma cylindrosporum h7]
MGGDHKCPVCQATFTRPQHVARHMRSHTGDRPYKCQFCGDQFARSDLLSRHVNKCHASEKPLPATGNTRRKGSASASRATTSKQACDQCVQSSLPCDGSNPCSKCVQRKCRCTYVKFHRQTAPAGPGHHSSRPAAAAPVDPSSMSISGMPMSSALALSSGLGGINSSLPLSSGDPSASSSRIPLYHPDDDFILGPPPPLPGPSSSQHQHGHASSTTRGNNGIPTMAETLYGSNSFDFPVLYPPAAGTGPAGSVGSTSSDGGDVDSDYVTAAKYRAQAQAELFGSGRTTNVYDRPSSSSTSSSVAGNNNNPHAWLGWDHNQHQHSHSHSHSHQQMRHADAFSHQHSHHSGGSQRIASQAVDLSGSGAVDAGLGGGGLGIGATVGSSLHGNHFYAPSVRYT